MIPTKIINYTVYSIMKELIKYSPLPVRYIINMHHAWLYALVGYGNSNMEHGKYDQSIPCGNQ